jgi:hypothetical protein
MFSMLKYIVISRDEKQEKKCTLYPLRGRPDFSFRTKKDPGKISQNSILLFPNGEPLTRKLAKEIRGAFVERKEPIEIILIDSRWKKAKGIADSLPPIRRVSLIGYETGAKRRAPPPEGGLASCEALYLTSLFLGDPDLTLLDNYPFKDRFFMLNNLVRHKL